MTEQERLEYEKKLVTLAEETMKKCDNPYLMDDLVCDEYATKASDANNAGTLEQIRALARLGWELDELERWLIEEEKV